MRGGTYVTAENCGAYLDKPAASAPDPADYTTEVPVLMYHHFSETVIAEMGGEGMVRVLVEPVVSHRGADREDGGLHAVFLQNGEGGLVSSATTRSTVRRTSGPTSPPKTAARIWTSLRVDVVDHLLDGNGLISRVPEGLHVQREGFRLHYDVPGLRLAEMVIHEQDQCLQVVADIRDLCREKGVSLTVICSPTYISQLEILSMAYCVLQKA